MLSPSLSLPSHAPLSWGAEPPSPPYFKPWQYCARHVAGTTTCYKSVNVPRICALLP